MLPGVNTSCTGVTPLSRAFVHVCICFFICFEPELSVAGFVICLTRFLLLHPCNLRMMSPKMFNPSLADYTPVEYQCFTIWRCFSTNRLLTAVWTWLRAEWTFIFCCHTSCLVSSLCHTSSCAVGAILLSVPPQFPLLQHFEFDFYFHNIVNDCKVINLSTFWTRDAHYCKNCGSPCEQRDDTITAPFI